MVIDPADSNNFFMAGTKYDFVLHYVTIGKFTMDSSTLRIKEFEVSNTVKSQRLYAASLSAEYDYLFGCFSSTSKVSFYRL